MKKLSVSMSGFEQSAGWVYYLFQLFLLPELVILILNLFHQSVTIFSVNFIIFLVNFIGFYCIFISFLKDSFKVFTRNLKRILAIVFLGFVVYWVANALMHYLVLSVSPDHNNLNNAAIGTIAKDHLFLLLVGTVLLVPVAEELVFRGMIFGALYNQNKLFAYVLSAVAFSLIHLLGYLDDMTLIQALLSFMQYLPAGIVLAWTYAKTDTIFTPILIHAIINLIGTLTVR